MPYLGYVFCEKCGPPAQLDVDYLGTVNSYITDGRPSAAVDDRTLVWDYLVYRCPRCQGTFKYTYVDVERRVREYFSQTAVRQREYIDAVATAQDTEEARSTGQFFATGASKLRQRLKDMYEQ